MKVVHACYLPLSADHPDFGQIPRHPGRWVLNLAVAQKKHASIQLELVVQVPGSRRDFTAMVEGIPVHYLATPRRFRSATLFHFDAKSICRKIHALAPDLVHGHGLEDAYGLAAQRSRLPYIITAQGLHFLINSRVKPFLIARERIVEFMERRCLEKARHVIAKSRYVRDALAAKFPNLILHEIPNTFDERLLSVREQKRPNSVVFVGTISPWKGVDTLRQALLEVSHKIPGITLDIAGDSVNAPLPYEIEQKKLLRQDLGDRVTFHGQVEPMELARLVASSMALVAPSLEDMFGNQVVEAILLGTHSIVAEGTALSENVRRFGNGTVVPAKDPVALAGAIFKALSNPVPDATAQQARDAAAAAFAPAQIASMHQKVYEQILRE